MPACSSKEDLEATIGGALEAVRARIDDAAAKVQRPAGDVTLVAVSKAFPATAAAAALAVGHRVFGENRVQEAAEKWPTLRTEYPEAILHLIGPLQTNKVRQAIGLFDVIETLDRPKLALALVRERDRTGACPELYIQINTGEEPQKAGIPPAEADAFITACREQYELPVTGLMCIPPQDEPAAPHFALLAKIARRHSLKNLSMGMSADFETAIQLGATHVRVGTAIFGTRPVYRADG